jgi:tRNA pseudouridine38-40 synthase
MNSCAQHGDEPAIPDPGGGGLDRLGSSVQAKAHGADLPAGGAPVRLRLDLGYDGTGFAGWARQPAQRTVQDVLERALATVLRIPDVQVTCAGRTDAGVHARGQVAHVDVPTSAYDVAAPTLAFRLAGILPADLRVFRVGVAPAGFDARFSALSRRYAYRVSDQPFGVDPLRRHDVLAHRRPLDLDAMNAAARALLGEQDFAAFCRKREGATTVRTLLDLQWARAEDGLTVATVEADAFCHNMVRALVGAMLAVGDDRRPAAWPGLVLAGRVRDPGVHVVPAHGLTLEEVRYPADDELAARAHLTRRRREVSG